MSIYLIRHGETPGNRDRIVQIPETPLSDRGLDQAGRLARRLGGHPIRHILASDQARAAMTAQVLSESLGLEVESEPLLQERNFGDLRGTPYAELKEDLFGEGFAPPGGETWEEFHERVDRAWEKIERLALGLDGHLAVVTHGLVLHSLAARHLLLPEGANQGGESSLPRSIGNTALTIAEIAEIAEQAPGEEAPAWRVVLLACTEHLGSASPGAEEGITGI